MFEDIQSFFTTPPKRPTSQLGAGMSDQDEPAIPAFQKAWKDGALFDDLFGPAPFTLHGTVGRSGADNHRPDVAKVETFLGDAGYYKPLTNDGPSGWHSTNLDTAIRSFQKDTGLEVDGFLKPGGPTISKIGSLLGGSQPAIEPEAKPDKSDPWEIKIGGRDPGDPNKLKPPKEWETIGNGEADDEDEYPWPKAPQPVGEPVPLAARAEAPAGFMPRMPRPDTPEEQATYQQEYQQWLKDNWPKIQQNQVLVAQGYPPIDIPDPPLKPGERRPDIEDGIPHPIRHRPDPTPQPRPAPQPAPGPDIVFGPQGRPTIRLPGTTGPANPFPMPQSPDIWKILAGRVPKPKEPFDNHTISEEGAREHDAYAANLVRDSNPDETARYLKNVIGWSGDQGRGDVADLLGRFAKVDEAKAKTLQDAIHRASGERIPFRIAPLGEGLMQAPADQEITLPERNPWGNSAKADRWEAGNMAKALLGKSDYKDAVTHFAGEFKRDPVAARAYTAAIFEDMAATSPKQAVQFASAMGKAGLAEEAKTPEKQPDPVQVAQADTGTVTDASPIPPHPQASPSVGPTQDGDEQVAQAGALIPRVVNGAAATAGGAMVLQKLEEWRKKNQKSGEGSADGSVKASGTSMQPAEPQPPVPGLEPPKQPAGNKTELKPPPIKLDGYGTPIPDPERPNILIFPAQPGDPRDDILENRKGSAVTKADIDRWRDEFLASNAGWDHASGGRHQKTGEEIKEYHIPGLGGRMGNPHPGGGYTDLTFKTPEGKFVHIQTVDVDPRTGKPTQRELDNAERIRKRLADDEDAKGSRVSHDVILVPKRHQLPKSR